MSYRVEGRLNDSLRDDRPFQYLSLVILCVEEVCVLGQVDHGSDVVLGLVDDGQVEQPVETERNGRKLLDLIYSLHCKLFFVIRYS